MPSTIGAWPDDYDFVIVTAPLLTHSVKIDLPNAPSSPNHPTDTHRVRHSRGRQPVLERRTGALAELATRFSAEAQRQPQPELQLRADRNARYEGVAQVMALAARAGLLKIGFVSTPEPG